MMKNTSIEKEERVIQQSIRIRVEEKMASRSRLVGCGHKCVSHSSRAHLHTFSWSTFANIEIIELNVLYTLSIRFHSPLDGDFRISNTLFQITLFFFIVLL